MSDIYYKVLDKNMKSYYREFQYELGKTYTTDQEIRICHNGFHACRNMYELIVWVFYNKLEDCRFFKCTLGDNILEGEYKVSSNAITLIEEISLEEVDKDIKEHLDILIGYNDYLCNRNLVNNGYALDKLINDEDDWVRVSIASQGYGLDKLVYDKNAFVRAKVAKQGYGLDILINDEYSDIRDIAKSKLKELERGKDNE